MYKLALAKKMENGLAKAKWVFILCPLAEANGNEYAFIGIFQLLMDAYYIGLASIFLNYSLPLALANG